MDKYLAQIKIEQLFLSDEKKDMSKSEKLFNILSEMQESQLNKGKKFGILRISKLLDKELEK